LGHENLAPRICLQDEYLALDILRLGWVRFGYRSGDRQLPIVQSRTGGPGELLEVRISLFKYLDVREPEFANVMSDCGQTLS
jgi:hypothetical protein